MTRAPMDAAARAEALDPTRSFIVQAPAGSGKTELLTRRVLTLLAAVERPEEVLAITFTRKAAAEMRHRVIAALKRAQDPAPAENDYEAEGLALARKVLERDTALGWNLVDDPERLGMRTIDSLASNLAYRLPVLSQLGAPVTVTDDARALYNEAAERFLDHHVERIEGVSQKLDNKLDNLRDLLAKLLAIRDQWGRYIAEDFTDDDIRAALESMLASLISSRLAALQAVTPIGLIASLTPILQRAAGFLTVLEANGQLQLEQAHRNVLQFAATLEQLDGYRPGSELDDQAVWTQLADCLLKKSDASAYKTVNIKQGFPAASSAKKLGLDKQELSAHKDDMLELLRSLDGEARMLELLDEVRRLPQPAYSDEEWALLGQLGSGLRYLLGELRLVFTERRELDFVEVGSRALQALGEDLEPTDLALSMDLRVQHVLVDEFQDTSRSQFALFERLVAGWVEGDGRSFFAVGDPMQSIYRFREGDVGLFLRAVDEGIGPVPLVPLALQVNFRSVPTVIDWVNTHFAQAFPQEADRDIGAVTYEPSTAHLAGEGAVQVHVLDPAATEDAQQAEGERVAELVQEALARDNSGTVGVLLRARTHATGIVAALQARGIAFRAVELERLGSRPVVQDLVALALALRYPHDRTSWLSVLRGPLCGLVLTDLHALVADSDSASVVELMQRPERIKALCDDGRQRLQRFADEVLPAMDRAPRTALMPWVEALWLRLGGPAVCQDAIDLDAAERALARLAELEQMHGLWQRRSVLSAMADLYAGENMDDSASRVQIMTLHKSKGLEFDTVILPSLGRSPGGNQQRLLDWYESTVDGQPSLLLAPIDRPNAGEQERSAIGRLLKRFRASADAAEQVRLLYVACTRARGHLHLVASVKSGADGIPKPAARCLLAPVWPSLAALHAGVRTSEDSDDSSDMPDALPQIPRQQPFMRCSTDWALPEFHPFAWQLTPPAKTVTRAIEYDWQGSTARVIGTVVHGELQRLATLPEADRSTPDSAGMERIARALRTLAVTGDDLDVATAQVRRALDNTLQDERGRWTLHPHTEARSEWALSVPTVVEGQITQVQRVIIDRSFIDAEGSRWIVDYKTGSHEGGGLDQFLDREVERYREQLQTYAGILERMDPARPVRLGLWFPMVRGWREVTVAP